MLIVVFEGFEVLNYCFYLFVCLFVVCYQVGVFVGELFLVVVQVVVFFGQVVYCVDQLIDLVVQCGKFLLEIGWCVYGWKLYQQVGVKLWCMMFFGG